jgi:hypothetical protein
MCAETIEELEKDPDVKQRIEVADVAEDSKARDELLSFNINRVPTLVHDDTGATVSGKITIDGMRRFLNTGSKYGQ